MPMFEKSCGTIPYTKRNGEIYYLLIRTKDHKHCGFPKGHMEPGETEEETSLRETWEETFVKPQIRSEFRYEMSYRIDNGNQKTVVYFLADFSKQTPIHNKEFEDFDYLILPFDKAYEILTFENTRSMLKEAHRFLISK